VVGGHDSSWFDPMSAWPTMSATRDKIICDLWIFVNPLQLAQIGPVLLLVWGCIRLQPSHIVQRFQHFKHGSISTIPFLKKCETSFARCGFATVHRKALWMVEASGPAPVSETLATVLIMQSIRWRFSQGHQMWFNGPTCLANHGGNLRKPHCSHTKNRHQACLNPPTQVAAVPTWGKGGLGWIPYWPNWGILRCPTWRFNNNLKIVGHTWKIMEIMDMWYTRIKNDLLDLFCS